VARARALASAFAPVPNLALLISLRDLFVDEQSIALDAFSD
jgi:hypothetical protein